MIKISIHYNIKKEMVGNGLALLYIILMKKNKSFQEKEPYIVSNKER